MTDWRQIAAHISQASGKPFHPGMPRLVGGGCINTTVRLSDGKRSYFIKLNGVEFLEMFTAESAGLSEIAATRTIRTPSVICAGTTADRAYLVLECIELQGTSGSCQKLAGRQIAMMHRTVQQSFGWKRDNTIGSTPQSNLLCEDWILFWREQRLMPQFRLAADQGFSGRLQSTGEKLLARFPALIEHAPQPSLLHGDLWGGNMSCDREGRPVIYDPAVYYGDREADLAMTELFGGFANEFYAAYQDAWPLDPGYSVRKTLYNLYHILNHLNLFGGGYLGQAQTMIDRLLAELA